MVKKLLLISITLFLGVMSTFATAQTTTYNFSETFGADGAGYNYGTFTGTISAWSDGNIVSGSLSNFRWNGQLVTGYNTDNSYGGYIDPTGTVGYIGVAACSFMPHLIV